MCNVAREGLGEKSMRSFLVSRLRPDPRAGARRAVKT